MSYEVGSQKGLFHVGDDKYPSESSTQAEVEGERTSTVSRNVGVVDRLKAEMSLLIAPISASWRYHANLRTSVNKETDAR